jgi:hypothetical protein
MRSTLIVFLSLLTVRVSATETIPDEWKVCNLDSDCAIADGVGCVGPESVNKRFLKDYNRWARHENSVLDCAVNVAEREWQRKRTPRCKTGKCSDIKGDS